MAKSLEFEGLPEHGSKIDSFARKRQRQFLQKEERERKRANRHLLKPAEHEWTIIANPDCIYVVNGGEIIVSGKDFAEGVLPVNAEFLIREPGKENGQKQIERFNARQKRTDFLIFGKMWTN